MLFAEDLQRLVSEFGNKIQAPSSLLYVRLLPADDGSSYVVLHDNGFGYVSSERGVENYNKFTSSLDDLLYWIMFDVAKSMAVAYEVQNRVEGEDFRRVYFCRLLELMFLMNRDWGVRAQKEVDHILESSPFTDSDLK